MTPEEKAIELVNKYDDALTYLESKSKAKQCALIAVNEIIKANPHSNAFNTDVSSTMPYWNAVRKEIENL